MDIKQYLADKYSLDELKRKKAEASDRNADLGFLKTANTFLGGKGEAAQAGMDRNNKAVDDYQAEWDQAKKLDAEADAKAADAKLDDPNDPVASRFSEMMKKAGYDIPGLTPRMIKQYGLNPIQLMEAAKGRESRERIVDRQMSAKAQAQAKKDDFLNNPEFAVPGAKLTGEVKPNVTEVKDLRKATGVMNDFEKQAQELDELIKNNGSFEWGGESGSRMEALSGDLRMKAKELYNLGVLNGPDLDLLLRQIPDTSSFSSIFTLDNSARTKLGETAKGLRSAVDERLKSTGYTPEERASKQPATGLSTDEQKELEELERLEAEGKL